MSTRDLQAATVEQLRSIHALKSGALSMFDPMLARVAAERGETARERALCRR